MICPFATYRPVTNHGGQMAQHLGLVLHVQVGTGSLYDFFNNPSSQVSAHFWCAKDGTLEQYVDTNVVAWAEAAANASYLSIETEGQPSEALTQAQLAKVALVLSWAAGVYHFPIVGPVAHGQAGFTPHCNPDGSPDPTWGNHPCPDPIRLSQMPAIVALASPQPHRSEETNMIARDNVSGGTWVARPNGSIYTFNGAPYLGPLPKYAAQWGIGTAANPVVGIVSDNAGGFILATDNGGPQPAVYHIDSSGQYAK